MALTLRKSDKDVHRETKFRPGTLDEDARTVEVIAATETAVERWYGKEVIRCDNASIDASRLGGLKILDSHNRSTILATLGRAISYRISNRRLYVTVKFADTDAGRQAFELVQQGMIDKVSVGYSIHKTEEAGRGDDFTVTATRWTPYEVSLVSVPADDNAKIRGKTMAKRSRAAANRAPAEEFDDIPDIDGDDAEGDDQPIEPRRRQRSGDFRTSVASFRRDAERYRFDLDEFDEVVERSANLGEVREFMLEKLATRSRSAPTNPINGSEQRAYWNPTGARSTASVETNIVDAIAVRMGGSAQVENNPLAGMSMVDLGRQFLIASGANQRDLSTDRIVNAVIGEGGFSMRAGHTTSDFPMLLQEAGNRVLLERFNADASALKSLSKLQNLPDYRKRKFIRPGEAPLLEPVLENAEIKSSTLGKEFEEFELTLYGRMFDMSRQMIINDDLGAFADFFSLFASSALATEAEEFYKLLSANSGAGVTMSDGNPLFHASHGNIGAASVIDVDNVGKAREAMRKQKNVMGSWAASVVPAVLLVGPAKETEAQKLVAAINATEVSKGNPFSGKLSVLVENRISGNTWYLAAEPKTRPAFVHGYLEGGPMGPDVEAIEWTRSFGRSYKCKLEFGCGGLDWRAIYKNPGA